MATQVKCSCAKTPAPSNRFAGATARGVAAASKLAHATVAMSARPFMPSAVAYDAR